MSRVMKLRTLNHAVSEPACWGASHCLSSRCRKLLIRLKVTLALTPALSPGERENRFQRFVDRNPAVSALELQPGANDFRSGNMCPPLPGGEGWGEGERIHQQHQIAA